MGLTKKLWIMKEKTACSYLQCEENETGVEIGCSEIRNLLCL